MSIHIGIGGWTFEPWRGPFYPTGLAQKRELEYAGQHLTGIEINGTYYGSQKPETFANWAESVPDGFKFSVKASRFTTNRKVLKEGAGSIEKFLTQGLTRLGDRLGPIHWQFMATKKFERDDFAGFLDLLPDLQDGLPLRHAIEVREGRPRRLPLLHLGRKGSQPGGGASADRQARLTGVTGRRQSGVADYVSPIRIAASALR